MRIYQIPKFTTNPEDIWYLNTPKGVWLDLNHVAMVHPVQSLTSDHFKQARKFFNDYRETTSELGICSFQVDMLFGAPPYRFELLLNRQIAEEVKTYPTDEVDRVHQIHDDLIQAWKKAVGDIK